VRRIATETASYVAAERCSVVTSPDGAYAAIVETERVVVVELARATTIAEVGVATALEQTDVAWIGTPPRLLILSRRATNSTVHLIDLDGPRVRAEIQIEGTMRIGATVGAHALVIGSGSGGSSAVLTASDAHLTPYQFPGRSLPAAAGPAGRQFVVAIPGAIEEWDPQQRAPRKRMRLPRQALIAQLGGTERVVWMTTHQEPARIDVIAQINRTQPKFHELPEPIAHVSGHPQRDLLACVGRETGSVYIVDLDGRAPMRTVDLEGLGRADAAALFAGATIGVVAARAGQPLGLFVLESRAAILTMPPASPVASPVVPSSAPPPQRAPTAPSEDAINDDAPAPSSVYEPPAAPPGPTGANARFAARRFGVSGALGQPGAPQPTAASPAPTVVDGEPAPPPPEGTNENTPAPATPDLAGNQPAPPAPDRVGSESAPPPAAPPGRPTRAGLASLQLRGIARTPGATPGLRRPGGEPSEPPLATHEKPRFPAAAPRRMPFPAATLTRRPADPDGEQARHSSLYDAPHASREAPATRPHQPGGPTSPATPRAAIAPRAASMVAREAHAVSPPAPVTSPDAGHDAAARTGLASLQLRGVARVPSGPPRLRRLGSEPIASPTGETEEAPRPRTRELADAPAAPPVVRPPIAVAMAALAPRTTPTRCSPGEYQALLEHYRRFAADTALRAIARDWDSGRLAFSTHDRPPFEAEVLGIVGRRSGLAPAMVREATEALEAAAGALQGARSALAGRMSPLDLICAEHGVGKLGEIVLLFVAAPALWGELARLYGVLSNDSGRGTCDEHLLWQLLGHSTNRRELARELDPDSPLLHHGLIQAGDRGRPFQGLSANPIVVKLLAGSTVDDDLEHGVARVPAMVPLDELMIPAAVLDRGLADLAAAPPGLARVVVTGRGGSGRRTFLATLAGLAGRTLATIDAAMLIREKRVGALAGLLQHAHLRGWLPCVDGLETITSDDAATRGAVRELLRDHHGPLAVRLPRHVQPPLEPGYVMIELPTSTIAERAAQWSDILAGSRLEVHDLDELAARFTVGPGTIRNVVTSVARGAPADAGQAIETALRQYLESKLGAVATRVTRLANWSQIVLPADIHDSIVELVARIRHRRTVYDTWGFDQVMSTSRGLTALFQGGPGTGKTLVASAIANELGLDLYRIDLSRVMSKWIGETEQNLAKVFDSAEEGQALILFDEADSLFGKRTEVRTSVDRYANLETNYLLQRLDTFEGVAVLTTNFGTAIDAAFKRRLSCRLTFPFPDEEARERLWRVHLPEQLPLAGKLDLADLAHRYKMSGGYIRNAALRAAFLAAEEQVPLSQDHLERAVRAEFREGGKLAESGLLE